MTSSFSENHEKKSYHTYLKKWIKIGSAVGTAVLILSGCGENTAEEQNRKFEKFTKELFVQETAGNTISLHYTLKNPETYGIEKTPATFGTFSSDSDVLLASTENLEQIMETFSQEDLSVENQLTYDVLDDYLEQTETGAKYLLYEEPMGLVSGVQTQLPVILSEYLFYDREDVETYLALLQTTPEYFDSLIEFEQEKSKAGLFMADYMAEQVTEQCRAFMEMGESNYLYSTFAERIQSVPELSESEKSTYIQKNALMLDCYVLPAYSKLIAAIQDLMGTGTNEQGLCYLPGGKAYYEYVVRESTGSGRSAEEIRELTRQQIIEDLEAMEQILEVYDSSESEEKLQNDRQEEGTEAQQGGQQEDEIREAQETASVQVAAEIAQNPVSILEELKTKTSAAFPEPPKTTYSVKYVPKAMEEHLSPAFYMIPAIDAYDENVIYVNQAQMGNALTLYTTLAHEGYPGHLYQTVYYAGTDPDPIRSILNFGGYVEGWATYAEMCSYYLAPLTKEQATLLQKNSSIILGLYTLADIGIHYDGWSRIDTLTFFSGYGIKDADTVNRIYDLIIGCPGNYLKYYIGYVEFLELKKKYAAEQGDSYSQKAFHEAVLKVGPAPFEIVEEYMTKMGLEE